MAEVTVFVDDAVLGRLPSVCVKDGTYTDDHLTLRQELGGGSGLGILWLLILVGPVGWIALVVISYSRGSGGMLTVRLPFSQVAYERLVKSRRERWPWGIVTIVLGVVTLAYLLRMSEGNADALQDLLTAVAGAIVVVALIGWVSAATRFRKTRVDMDLDASRRWVTLRGVHPDFVAAVDQRVDHGVIR